MTRPVARPHAKSARERVAACDGRKGNGRGLRVSLVLMAMPVSMSIRCQRGHENAHDCNTRAVCRPGGTSTARCAHGVCGRGLSCELCSMRMLHTWLHNLIANLASAEYHSSITSYDIGTSPVAFAAAGRTSTPCEPTRYDVKPSLPTSIRTRAAGPRPRVRPRTPPSSCTTCWGGIGASPSKARSTHPRTSCNPSP